MVIGCVALTCGGFACEETSEIVARERAATDDSPSDGGAFGGESGDGDSNSGDGDGDSNSGDGGSPSGGTPGVERPIFAAPVPVVELNDPDAKDQDPSLTSDQLEIFFFSERGGDPDIWMAKRVALDADWDSPVPVVELNSPEAEQNPTISRDGLRMWYYSSREPLGIYFAQRESRSATFGTPEHIPISGDAEGFAIAPAIDITELRMAVSIGEGDSRDLYEVVRASPTATWGDAAALSGVNSGDYAESTPFLIDEGREVLFHSGRSGGGDLFWAYREAPGLPFTQVAPITEANDPASFETHPHLTTDRRWLYFGSDRSGNTDIYLAEMLPQ